ncbi:MAG: hypothetical protein M9920_12075 [Verrucomicrobiae bacterium]|nr:hypothetical protein [Verrucomicrobiae bacterium]
MKSLDQKLAEIKANPASRAFILADAKDADMAYGVRVIKEQISSQTKYNVPFSFLTGMVSLSRECCNH